MSRSDDEEIFDGNNNEIDGAGEKQETAFSPASLNDKDSEDCSKAVSNDNEGECGNETPSAPSLRSGASPQGEAEASNSAPDLPLEGKGDRVAVEEAHSDGNSENGEASPAADDNAKENLQGKKKIGSVVKVVLTSLLFILAICIFVVSITARINGTQPEFFGISFSIVLTDSMTPEIEVGDLVVVRRCDITEVEEGDNAVFISLSGAVKGQRIIHKVVKVGTDDEGAYLRTQGVKTGAVIDENYVRSDNFVGVEVFHSTVLGKIVSFFSKAQNWILIAVLAALGIFAYKQVRRIIKYTKEK